MSTPRRLISSLLVGAGSLALATAASGQSGTSVYEGDWPEYHGDHFAQRYSPLDQINAENVGDIEIAWQFSTQNFGPSTDFNNPSTPIEINGVLYANIGSTRNVVALDATTGQVLWLWRPQEGERFDEAPRKGAGRGVAYWTDGDKKRVIDVTPGYHLVSLDAETGVPDPDFGQGGIVDLFVGLRNADDPRFPFPDIGLSAAPFVMNDVIVVGAAHRVVMRAQVNCSGHSAPSLSGEITDTSPGLTVGLNLPETPEFGRRSQVTLSLAMSICRSNLRPETGMEEIVRETTCFPIQLWRLISRPARDNGTISLLITISGIGTFRQLR